MNKINVLYQNLNFEKSGDCDLKENLDAPIFASDETLTDLLRKASIAKFGKGHKNESGKKEASVFQKHPRYITDDSLVSVDEHENPVIDTFSNKSQQIDSIIRKVTFKRHVKLEATEKSLLESISNNSNCQIIKAKNVKITEKQIKECLKNITDRDEVDKPKVETKKVPKTEVKEDFLGVKLKSCLIKICSWMQETRTSIASGIDPLESAEDYFRRQRRAAEFGNRFNRNYLYQLSRQLVELRRYAQKTSTRPGAPGTARALTNACQTVLQAVQAYCNHIPSTISIRGSSEGTVHAKFCELLKDTCDLCRIIKKLSCIYYDVASSLSLIEEVEANSKSLMILVEETLMKKNEIENKPLPKPKTAPKNKGGMSQRDKKHFESPFHKLNSLESRLSMYSVAFKKPQRNNPNWKKNAEKLAHQRFNVQSRYKNPKQQLPTEIVTKSNTPVATENKRKSIAPKKSSRQSDSASVTSIEPIRINEDEIPTLVGMDNKKSSQDIVPTSGGIRSRIEPLLQSLVAEVSAGKKDDLLAQGVSEDMLLKLQDLLNHVQHPVQNLSPKQPEMKFLPRNQVSITGPKNAKLICVKDKSLFESKTEVKPLICRFEDPLPQPKSLSVLPALERKLSKKLNESNSQTMANLPKQYTINIIQYKINFHKYTKPLMMYRKSSQVLPWILTGKITDALFEHLMLSVISEINIDGLAEKLYQSEFETCC